MSNQPPLSPRLSSHVSGLPSGSSKVLAVAGLVFAIVSILAVLFFLLLGLLIDAFFVGSVCSIVGVVLSALGLRSPSSRALSIVGLTLSIVVLVMLVLLLLFITPVSRVEHHSPAPTVVPRNATP